MSNYTELLEIIKKAAKDAYEASNPTGILYGTVTNVNPLEINVEQRMTLSREFLILTKNVVDYTVDVNINWSTEVKNLNVNHNHSIGGELSINSNATINPNPDNINISIENEINNKMVIEQKNIDISHKHDISGIKTLTICNGLKNGDKVILIRVQGGQRYIVLDKVY